MKIRPRRRPGARLVPVLWMVATLLVAAWLCWGDTDDHRTLLITGGAAVAGVVLQRRPGLLLAALALLMMAYPLLGVGPVLAVVLTALLGWPFALYMGIWLGPGEPRRRGPVRRRRGRRR